MVKRPKARKCLSLLNALESTPAIFVVGVWVEVLEKVFLKQWVNWGFIVGFVMVNSWVCHVRQLLVSFK